jgi:hypothetical protein
MVPCAIAVPVYNAPTNDNAIAHRSVFIVRDLLSEREVDVSTERIHVSLAAGEGFNCCAFVRPA